MSERDSGKRGSERRQLLPTTRALWPMVGVIWALVAAAQTPPTTPPGAAPPSKPLSTSLGLVVFPAQGQAADKQAADEGECFAWAKGQTGVDPFAPPPAAPAQAQPEESQRGADGSRLRGAARGAAAGAIIGEVADDDAGEGAAIGATVGVMKGGAESRRKQKEAEQQAQAQAAQQTQQQQAVLNEQRALFNKGFAACLEARGYTVK